ncbi:MAG: molybdopterin-binding protein, partial [Cyanobacteria bacterium P01_C01_bin.73]
MVLPHGSTLARRARVYVITVSDSRTADTDRSGQLIKTLLREANHRLEGYQILQDEPSAIQQLLYQLSGTAAEAIILNGGTGIAPRDTTYDAIAALL